MPAATMSTAGMVAICIFTACVAGTAVGGSPDSSTRVVQLLPAADTWIEVPYPPGIGQRPNPHSNGDDTRLRAGWWDYGINERILMRFDLPLMVEGEALRGATLVLPISHATIGTFDPPVVTDGTIWLRLQELAGPWDESTLTGADRVATGPVQVVSQVPWGPCRRDQGCGTARIDILPLGEEWMVASDANFGLVIDATGIVERPTTGTTFQTNSRESQDPPVLELEFGGPVEMPTATPTENGPARQRVWVPRAVIGVR